MQVNDIYVFCQREKRNDSEKDTKQQQQKYIEPDPDPGQFIDFCICCHSDAEQTYDTYIYGAYKRSVWLPVLEFKFSLYTSLHHPELDRNSV